jgi:hypothetical protein
VHEALQRDGARRVPPDAINVRQRVVEGEVCELDGVGACAWGGENIGAP